MSARDEVLAAVRNALGPERRPEVAIPRGYRDHPAVHDQRPLIEVFAERVADYRATVTRCTAAEVEDRIAAALGDALRVVIPDDLYYDVPRTVPDRSLSAADLDSVDAVVTRAAVGIAETGTIVLDHSTGQGRRALSLVPDLHVCVLDAAQVVPGVADAVAVLDPNRPQTWISGPSATSDIELNRVEGVHGPRRLHVILVEH